MEKMEMVLIKLGLWFCCFHPDPSTGSQSLRDAFLVTIYFSGKVIGLC